MKYCERCHSTYPTDFSTCPKDQGVLREITDLSPGMVLRGKYRIEEKIGEGGMASVYRASHLHFNEELAIKVVGAALTNNPEFLERFKREAVITRKLHHPNAVRLDDFDFTEDGRPFIAMEFVRGKSLRTVLQENGHLPIPRAFNIARQVALALAAAHKLGIIHRDIKPDNVVLTPQPDGTDLVKVLDFGIAKVTGDNFQSGPGYTPTSTGLVLGTPHYLSPEQARGKKSAELDGRADLYALGVMLYEMISGELPFKSDTAIEMLLHHIQSAPTPTHLLKPELNIPEDASALIMMALAKDPANRFQSGEAMAAALSQFVGPAGAQASYATPSGGSVAAFNTAALATAAGAPGAASPRIATPSNPPTTLPVASAPETRVLGSASFTMQTPAQSTAPAAIAPTEHSTAPPKTKRKLWRWIAAAAVVLLVSWLGIGLYNARQDAQSPQTGPAYATTPPQTENPPDYSDRRPSRRSRQTYSQPQYTQPASSQPSYSQPSYAQTQEQIAAAQRARAQQLVNQGNMLLAQRNFQAAAAEYQEALQLDPNNSAARNGLKTASAGGLVQGLSGFFHR